VLVGSSMGGWIALLVAIGLAQSQPGRIGGLVLVAPAPDFTETLIWERLSPAEQVEVETTGQLMMPSPWSDPYPLTRGLIRDGREHLILDTPIETGAPVHILQGIRDEEVPWRHALRVVEGIARDDVVVTLVKDGDHRLSRPEDIARMLDAVAAIAAR
jgi:pimeloyl-ACP methyl ester carboxylesterase